MGWGEWSTEGINYIISNLEGEWSADGYWKSEERFLFEVLRIHYFSDAHQTIIFLPLS